MKTYIATYHNGLSVTHGTVDVALGEPQRALEKFLRENHSFDLGLTRFYIAQPAVTAVPTLNLKMFDVSFPLSPSIVPVVS